MLFKYFLLYFFSIKSVLPFTYVRYSFSMGFFFYSSFALGFVDLEHNLSCRNIRFDVIPIFQYTGLVSGYGRLLVFVIV